MAIERNVESVITHRKLTGLKGLPKGAVQRKPDIESSILINIVNMSPGMQNLIPKKGGNMLTKKAKDKCLS